MSLERDERISQMQLIQQEIEGGLSDEEYAELKALEELHGITLEEAAKMHVVTWGEGILAALFGTPFLLAGLFTFVFGIDLLISQGEPEGIFLTCFSLPFTAVGGTIVVQGLRSFGRGIGLITPKDPALVPRDGPIGPESIHIEHPDSSYSGIYKRQSNIINGKDWYRKISGDQRLYFYAANEGGVPGWSLDDQIDNGSKDWFNGGWIPDMPYRNIPFGTHEWCDVEGYITIQEIDFVEDVNENNEIENNNDLVDMFKKQLMDSFDEK